MLKRCGSIGLIVLLILHVSVHHHTVLFCLTACGVGYFVFDALRSTLEGKSNVNLGPPEAVALSVDNIEPSLS